MANIFCVEDDTGIRELITCALQSGGYTAEGFPDGKSFFHRLRDDKPALILLDIMLPDEDGISILKRLKGNDATAEIPVIMLSAKSSEIDKVTGLENGADDYITKPFSLAELKVRIDAHLRREHREKQIQRKVFGDITVDYSAQEVLVRGESMHFLRKEFEIIRMLSLNSGQVFSRSYIYETIWGLEACGDDNVIMEHIRKIRQKFGKAGCINPIETVWGLGYKWIK